MDKTQYFSHDCHARHDKKIEKLMADLGTDGYGIYWCLIEMIYEEKGKLELSEIKTYAKTMNAKADRVEKVIKNFKLFRVNGKFFYSPSASRRLKRINEIREERRKSGSLGGKAKAGTPSVKVTGPDGLLLSREAVCHKCRKCNYLKDPSWAWCNYDLKPVSKG